MRSWRQHRTGIAAVLAGAALLAASAPLSAVMHHVDCAGGEYTTIAAAVTAASDGDTVLIAPCLYTERVVVEGKNLVILGSGADVTELTWTEAGTTLVFHDLPDGPMGSHVEELTISHPGHYGQCIAIDLGLVVLERCRTEGWTRAEPLYYLSDADIEAYHCELDEVSISDDRDRASTFEHCTLTSLYTSGGFDPVYGWVGDPVVQVTDCDIRMLSLQGGDVTVSGGQAEYVWATHGLHSHVRLTVEDCAGKWFVAEGLGEVTLHGCELDTLWALGGYYPDDFDMSGSLVRRETVLYSSSVFELTHNTFGGTVSCTWHSADSVTSNIFENGFASHNDAGVLFTSNCFGVLPSMPSATFIGNIEADPLFCGPDNYLLQECSPCIGAAHDNTDIGAFGAGCECSSTVSHVSWGRLKTLFR